MTRKLTPTRTATAAIAAALAFSSTPLLAQDAAPVIVLPDVTASSAVAAPATAPAPAPSMVSTPVVQAVPTVEAAAPVPEAQPSVSEATATPVRTTRAAAPVRPAAPAPMQSVAADAPTAADPALISDTSVPALPVAPIAAPADAVSPDATIADADENSTGALLAGGAVIGLGLLGFAAFRRRKTGARKQAVPVIEKPRVASTPPVSAAAPIMVSSNTGEPRSIAAASRPVMATGGVVPLPRAMPEQYEEREALLRRMVAARPDRANPFRTPKARRHRAKLILQSLSQDFATREPRIDLSDYPANWPMVARRNYATAA